MLWQYTPTIIPFLFSAGVTSICAGVAWNRRSSPGAIPLAVLLCAITIWSLGYLMELVSVTLPEKLWWAKVEYIGLVMVPVSWVCFTLQYTGKEKWINRRNILLASVIPLAVLAASWTNEAHHWIYTQTSLKNVGILQVLIVQHGWLFWVYAAYCYFMMLFGTLILGKTFLSSSKLHRRQQGMVLLGALAPWFANALYIFHLNPFQYFDLTPFAFSLSGLTAFWGFFQFRLLELTPIARNVVVEQMRDAVFVVDLSRRIVDLNLAARHWVGMSKEPVGQHLQDALPQTFPWEKLLGEQNTDSFGVTSEEENPCHPVEASITLLRNNAGLAIGKIIIVRDMTERKQAEQALIESEQRFRTSIDTLLDGFAIFSSIRNDAGAIIDFRYDYINEAGCRLNQRSAEEQLGHTLLELLPGHKDAGLLDAYTQVVETGQPLMRDSLLYEDVYGGGKVLARAFNFQAVKLGDGFAVTWRDVTEREWKNAEIQEKNRLIQLLKEVAVVANETTHLETALQFVLDRVCQYTGWPVAHVYMQSDPNTRILRPTGIWHLDDPERFQNFKNVTEKTEFEPGYELPGQAFERGEPVWVSDASQDPEFHRAKLASDIGVRAGLAFPILVGKKAVGVFEFFAQAPEAPNGSLLQVMSQIGTQVGRVVERIQADGALQASEKHFRALIERSTDVIALVDDEGIIRYESSSVERVLGYQPGELIGTLAFNLVHAEDQPAIATKFFDLLQNPDQTVTTDARVQHKDGSWRWMEVIGTNLLFEPSIKMIVTNFSDITGRKQMEEELRESEQRYRNLFITAQRQAQELSLLDQVRSALAREVDMGVILRTVVEAISRTFDYQLVSIYLIQGNLLILQHQIGYENVLSQIPMGQGVISKSIQAGQPILVPDVSAEPAFLGAIQGIVSEIVVPLSLRGQIIGILNVESTQGVRLEEHDLRLLIALGENINIAFERAQLYAEARESEERFRASIETLLDGFAIFSSIKNETGKIVDFQTEYVNENGCKLAGIARQDFVGHKLLEALPIHQKTGLMEDYRKLVNTGQPMIKEFLFNEDSGGGGQRLTQALDIRAVKLGDGFAVSWRDITERKQAEDQLASWVMQLERHNREITLLNELGELFQACRTKEEAYQIIASYIQKLFPDESGVLYIANSSNTLLEAVSSWGELASAAPIFEPGDCWALRRGKIHLVESSHLETACEHINHASVSSSLCVPMIAQNETLGILTLVNSITEGNNMGQREEIQLHLSEPKQKLAVTVAEHVTLALANLKLRDTLRHQAIRDPLTNLFNRRYMEETLEREISRADRKTVSLGIILLDIDHFKSFNDTFGHDAGDAVLRELGRFLVTHIRKEDVACRFGGEEFLLILPDAPFDDICQRAEELRAGVMLLEVKHCGRLLAGITISLGISAFPTHGTTIDRLLKAADLALYKAKKEGRNRLAVANDSPIT